MKTTFKFLGALALLFSLFFTSCREDNPYLTCKIDGKDFTSLVRVTYRGNLPAVGESFLITATNGTDISNGEYLTILVRGVAEKEYRLDVELLEGKYEAAAVYKPNGENDTTSTAKYYGYDGSITLTKVDEKHKKISGTFSFSLRNKNGDIIKITDGKFENLIYIEGSFATDEFDEENQ